MIPFDLQKALDGRPVRTRNGLSVRISTYDRRDDISGEVIVALVDMGETEEIYTYRKDGTSQSVAEDLWLRLEGEARHGWIVVCLAEDGTCYTEKPVWENPDEADHEVYRLRNEGVYAVKAEVQYEI